MNVAIILNYKAAAATIRCVESIVSYCRSIDFLVVVDNDSQDGSYERLTKWFINSKIRHAVVLSNPENTGYAGGNNFGIKWAMRELPVDNFWIVNNDTYVESDAFFPFFEELKRNKDQFLGSVIFNAEDRSLECFGGGVLYPMLGKSKLLGKGLNINDVSGEPDYIMGCSLAFSASIIPVIGLMDECYFMYSEEVDWQFRGKAQGFLLKVVPTSEIYHIGSLSSGSKSSFYYFYRNRAAIRLNKKFYGVSFALCSSLVLSLITLAQEIKRPIVAWSGIKGALSGVIMDVK